MSYKALTGSRRISAILIFFTLAFNAAAAAPSDRAQIAPGYQKLQSIAAQQGEVRVIVQVSDSGSPGGNRQQSINNALGKLKSGLAKSGIRPVKEYRKLPLMVFSVTSAQLDLLVDSTLVEAVYEDGIARPTLPESIPYIGGDIAHAAGLNGSGVAVAILDTGVDAGHVAFGGRVVGEACFSTRSGPGGSYSVCPNGSSNGQYGAGSAVPCSITGCDHGTHVASIAAGSYSNKIGAAPQADIIAIQVFSRFTSSSTTCGGGGECIASYYSDVIDAMEYVATLASTYTIGSVNLSLSGGGEYQAACDGQPHKAAADALNLLKIPVVAASGNDGYTNGIGVPACVSSVYSVGAMYDVDDSIPNWSNSASFLDMMAPGSGVRAAAAGGGTANKAGTSMAAPHVAGAFALLRANDANLTVAQMKALLEDNSEPLLDSRNGYTFPRLDLGLVTYALTGAPGDINNDGNVDVADLLLLQQALVGTLNLTPSQLLRADLYPSGGDGVADVSDLLTLQALVVAP